MKKIFVAIAVITVLIVLYVVVGSKTEPTGTVENTSTESSKPSWNNELTLTYPIGAIVSTTSEELYIGSQIYDVRISVFKNVNLSDFVSWEPGLYRIDSSNLSEHKTIVLRRQSGTAERVNTYIVIKDEYPRSLDDDGKNITLARIHTVEPDTLNPSIVEEIIKSIKFKN
jgi:hypothetical protein